MNNFVFHEEYIIDIPAEKRAEFTMYIIDYGLYGKSPSLSGFELVFWKTIQRRIDVDKINYDSSCLKQKINAINSRIKNNKASEHDLSNLELFKTKLSELNEVKRNNSFKTDLNKLNEKNNLKLTHHDIESEFDIEFDNEFDIEFDNDANKKQMPDVNPPSNKVLSEKIFKLFNDAKLPCCKGNPITFLQMDFSNGMRYIHQSDDLKGIHSDDIIGAVQNYISAINNPDSYITSKMNFYSFVKSKLFYNLLPSNYTDASFKKYGSSDGVIKETHIYMPDRCPNCDKVHLYWDEKKDRYICDDCGTQYTFEDIQGDYL